MWLEVGPVHYCDGVAVGGGGPPLRHSASFSCLSRGAGARMAPHRARTATLPSAPAIDTDYGFVKSPYKYKYGPVVEEEYEEEAPGKKELTSIREVLIKKSASLLSPTAWWSPRSRRARHKEDPRLEEEQHQRRWRSLGALLRTGHPPPMPPQNPSPRAQSFYLLDDFLRPQNRRRDKATSSSDSLELSSPMPPPVPPPPPPLRLLRYRHPCDCVQCRRDRDGVLLSDTLATKNKRGDD